MTARVPRAITIPAIDDTSKPALMILSIDQQPNNAPEPTPVGAGISAIAVNIISPAWLSFIR